MFKLNAIAVCSYQIKRLRDFEYIAYKNFDIMHKNAGIFKEVADDVEISS